MVFKKIIQNFLWCHGYEMQTTEYSGKSTTLTRLLLNDVRADFILDIGANEGQFAKEVLLYENKIPILSFEPLTSAHEKLFRNSRLYKNWKVAPRMALSSKSGKTQIHISNNSVSSSLKQIEARCLSAAPDSRYIGKEDVEMKTLDEVLFNDYEKYERLYIKLDVQGSEKDILAGAKEILKKTKALQIEISIVSLYTEEALLSEWLDYARILGFKLYAFSNGFRDPNTKELLQCDGFFIRDEF